MMCPIPVPWTYIDNQLNENLLFTFPNRSCPSSSRARRRCPDMWQKSSCCHNTNNNKRTCTVVTFPLDPDHPKSPPIPWLKEPLCISFTVVTFPLDPDHPKSPPIPWLKEPLCISFTVVTFPLDPDQYKVPAGSIVNSRTILPFTMVLFSRALKTYVNLSKAKGVKA